MASNKRTDLNQFAGVLPYASELFGIYQPLIGWKSKRQEQRIQAGWKTTQQSIFSQIRNQFRANVSYELNSDGMLTLNTIEPGVLRDEIKKPFDSLLLQHIAANLPPEDSIRDSDWKEFLGESNINALLKERVLSDFNTHLNGKTLFNLIENDAALSQLPRDEAKQQLLDKLNTQFSHESTTAAVLQHLLQNKNYDTLKALFYPPSKQAATSTSLSVNLNRLGALDALGLDNTLGLDNIDPRKPGDLSRVALSPISVVHLYRQYFFELDSFLGTPVNHIWLSPGSSVELIEVSTKKTIVEKTLETAIDSLQKTETNADFHDDLSESVRHDNKQDLKLGASVTAKYASITATTSFDMRNTQQRAKQEAHQRSRQQSEKLASNIRKSMYSTFKTTTETTDISSKHYSLANHTDKLINYEMRRKMRHVGVQVQDVGSYLCWQTFVDDPGQSLGIAELVHIAKPADLDQIPHPQEIAYPEIETTRVPYTIPFLTSDGADNDEPFEDGAEVDKEVGENQGDRISSIFEVRGILPPKDGYVIDSVTIDNLGQTVNISLIEPLPWSQKDPVSQEPIKAPPYDFQINLDWVNFQGKDSLNVEFQIRWKPSKKLLSAVDDKNNANRTNFNEKAAYEHKKAYLESARERIKLASKIEQRKSEDLREEERIVIYRKLIQDMLMNEISMPDDKTRHIVSELINNIFDVDKMLYFVAPEWWQPRLHQSHQFSNNHSFNARQGSIFKNITQAGSAIQRFGAGNLAATAVGQPLTNNSKNNHGSATLLSASAVTWGGAGEIGRDNYFITEESTPAKLGSSLGWLLQLDGDNQRNAFLNAPWVKTVIPIRPGKERAAINWLKKIEGMNGISDEDIYQAPPPKHNLDGSVIEESIEKDVEGRPLDGQRMLDVIMDLAKKIELKHAKAMEKDAYPKIEDIANPKLVDPENTVTSTPVDRVYEHGFYALKDGFRANLGDQPYAIFDQWTEILPTDQIVPVEVQYDPLDGRMLKPLI